MDIVDIIYAKKFGGGGGGAKSWNDLTGKPFGEETSVVEVLAETTLTPDATGMAILPDVLDLAVGDKCTVNWRGVEYVRNAKAIPMNDGTSVVGVGNPSIGTNGENSGEPFLILNLPAEMAAAVGGKAAIFSADGAAFAVSVYKDNTVITPIEGKYLPKGTPWIEEGGMVEVLPETTVTGEEGYELFIPNIIDVTVGATYIVTHNGVDYEQVGQAVDVDGISAVGFGDLTNFGATGNGEPFTMIIFPADIASQMGVGGMLVNADGSTSATISIYGEGEIAHPIDPRCLPEGVPTLFNVNVTTSDDGYTADKTYAEIYVKAFDEGTIIRCLLSTDSGTSVLSLAGATSEYVIFSLASLTTSSAGMLQSVKINADDTVEFFYKII